jgi:phage N-6-adenine-methyltransferase
MNTELMFSSEDQTHATPWWLMALIQREFQLQIDVCALPTSAKLPRYWAPTDNALAQNWNWIRGWMNPPCGREISLWMAKAYAASHTGATVVCLVPARTDTAWWHSTARHGYVRFIKGRLKFGEATNGAPFPSALVIFGGGYPEARTEYWDYIGMYQADQAQVGYEAEEMQLDVLAAIQNMPVRAAA